MIENKGIGSKYIRCDKCRDLVLITLICILLYGMSSASL